MADGQELYSEYATAKKMWENKEYRERKARENGFIDPDEVVVEINEG